MRLRAGGEDKLDDDLYVLCTSQYMRICDARSFGEHHTQLLPCNTRPPLHDEGSTTLTADLRCSADCHLGFPHQVLEESFLHVRELSGHDGVPVHLIINDRAESAVVRPIQHILVLTLHEDLEAHVYYSLDLRGIAPVPCCGGSTQLHVAVLLDIVAARDEQNSAVS